MEYSNKQDLMDKEEYPGILRRFLSTLLDSLFILLMVIVAGYLFQSNNQMATNVRIGMILFLFFVYEPLCTSKFCTIGQKVTGIRVRGISSRKKISISKAYLRILVKILLGFISFFTLPFTKNKRAIHDFAANSIVIKHV